MSGNWSIDETCCYCEHKGHISKGCNEKTKEVGSPLNTHKQQQVYWDKFEKAKESGESHLNAE